MVIGIRTWHNDIAVQDGTTADMVLPVAQLISYLSTYFTLHPR
ncbi:fumarylacetoacetate hydrolase family protein [Nocardia miyunensis]|nr:fumarylacetoacetate hydrolase family protein [Nocardia miyunensis]